MAISYVGVSNNAAAASGNVTVTPPATQTNDIMICAVTTHDNVAVTFPSGWTIYQEANNTTAMRATLAWKRCTGAEGAFTVTHTAGDGIVATAIVFRGCVTSGSPINNSILTANASSSTCTAATITSTVDGCWLLFTMHDSDNGASSAQSSANLGAMTERFDNASTSGLDQAVSGAHVSQTSAGASGASTGTLSLGPDVNSGGNTFLAPYVILPCEAYAAEAILSYVAPCETYAAEAILSYVVATEIYAAEGILDYAISTQPCEVYATEAILDYLFPPAEVYAAETILSYEVNPCEVYAVEGILDYVVPAEVYAAEAILDYEFPPCEAYAAEAVLDYELATNEPCEIYAAEGVLDYVEFAPCEVYVAEGVLDYELAPNIPCEVYAAEIVLAYYTPTEGGWWGWFSYWFVMHPARRFWAFHHFKGKQNLDGVSTDEEKLRER